MNITTKLNHAALELAEAQAAHSTAALEAEDSGTPAAKASLAKAAGVIQTARQRVVDLQAAPTADAGMAGGVAQSGANRGARGSTHTTPWACSSSIRGIRRGTA